MANLFKNCLYLTIQTVHKSIKPNCLCVLTTRNCTSTSTIPENPGPNKDNQKTVRVAVIGVPNAGKSTFINNLINHRVCPTSSKVHTTRRSNIAIYTEKKTQVQIFDTPGLVTKKDIKKHNLISTFSSSYRHSIQHADLITVIHDVSNTWQRHQLHHTVLETLQAYPQLPSLLIINKIDLLKSKRILLDLAKNLTNNNLACKQKLDKLKNIKKEIIKKTTTATTTTTTKEISKGWDNFADVFMVSSTIGDGLHEVMRCILNYAKPNEWKFPANVYTDDTPENLIVESVRARLLDYLPQEIPYLLECQIEHYSVEKKIIYASVEVLCPSPRIERLICGESNGKLKQITERITSDLVESFNKAVSLTISTKNTKKTAQAVFS